MVIIMCILMKGLIYLIQIKYYIHIILTKFIGIIKLYFKRELITTELELFRIPDLEISIKIINNY